MSMSRIRCGPRREPPSGEGPRRRRIPAGAYRRGPRRPQAWTIATRSPPAEIDEAPELVVGQVVEETRLTSRVVGLQLRDEPGPGVGPVGVGGPGGDAEH